MSIDVNDVADLIPCVCLPIPFEKGASLSDFCSRNIAALSQNAGEGALVCSLTPSGDRIEVAQMWQSVCVLRELLAIISTQASGPTIDGGPGS